jgi:hypothetical protein
MPSSGPNTPATRFNPCRYPSYEGSCGYQAVQIPPSVFIDVFDRAALVHHPSQINTNDLLISMKVKYV